MSIDGRRGRSWRRVALQGMALIALIAAWSCAGDRVDASAPERGGAAQSTSEDPCRYITGDAVGKAFGFGTVKGTKLVDRCEFRGPGNDVVYVKIATGTEGTIFRHTKTAFAEGHKGAEKLTTTVGEAYFDSVLPVFIGRVGNREVQVETTIEPLPRNAMIAVGTSVLEALARK